MHALPQQSLLAPHAPPIDVHGVSVHTPPEQPSEQQSAAVVHAPPVGSQVPMPEAQVNVPVPLSAHCPEQHVAPLLHATPKPSQFAVLHVPSQNPAQHSVLSPQVSLSALSGQAGPSPPESVGCSAGLLAAARDGGDGHEREQ